MELRVLLSRFGGYPGLGMNRLASGKIGNVVITEVTRLWFGWVGLCVGERGEKGACNPFIPILPDLFCAGHETTGRPDQARICI